MKKTDDSISETTEREFSCENLTPIESQSVSDSEASESDAKSSKLRLILGFAAGVLELAGKIFLSIFRVRHG